ncbi:hypothetical protein DFJ67_2306 [Asanoa ferruginea]|uniref:Uncharacterized protein n=1 Tax=Asanoa ferruginea TaxID=53367 RepID=A0A3D9ZHK5_9ACTN|nr:hypothetical protein [Asanoa ferruginea]REF96329.1 hypothetical protein DFJ67_2306 [Asanoa ferruginea]GIF46978.1 hypothetical protein Afe04nite_15170 [Asanoa ferruginea]
MSEPVAVDFDLLADYVGGALAGTPDEARVATLVDADPAWAAEHDSLVAALAATADDLALLTDQTAEPMPDEVVARLVAALPSAHPVPAQRAEPATGPARDNRAPRASRPAARPLGRARQRSRWLIVAAPVLVALAVAVLGGLWINGSMTGLDSTTASDAGGEAAVAQAPAAGDAAAIPRAMSGRDYDAPGVTGGFLRASRSAVSLPPLPQATAGDVTKSTEKTPATFSSMEGPLARLNAAAALQVCVDAIAAAHGQGPITVELADYAAFDGRPAVVVFFTDGAGARWGWAVGPDCGLAGTDELFRARVG